MSQSVAVSSVGSLDRIHELEHQIAELLPAQLDIDRVTAHHHCDGVYARQLFLPAGTIAVGKMHLEENFFLLVSGEVTMATDDGPVRLTAPFMCITKPGSKRIAYAHTDVVMLNFHANPSNERDVERLEARYVVPHDMESEMLALFTEDRKQLEAHKEAA